MSKMAYQTPIETSVDMITQFGGYNHNISISDGEFYDMENLSSDKYPIVSVRGKRVLLSKEFTTGDAEQDELLDTSNVFSVSEGGSFIAVNDGIYLFKAMPITENTESEEELNEYTLWIFKYDETNNIWEPKYAPIDLSTDDLLIETSTDPTEDMQYSVNMGAQIVIFPAKLIYNTIKNTLTNIDYTEEADENNPFPCTIVNHNGTTISSINYVSTVEPTSPTNAQYWLDTSQKPAVLKRYSSASGMWATVQAYLRISGIASAYSPTQIASETGLTGDYWSEGDAVKLDLTKFVKYSSSTYTNVDFIGKADNQKYWVIYEAKDGASQSDNYIEVPINLSGAIPSDSVYYKGTISRSMPLFDYITECNNRLWACRYGEDESGDPVNEIFACKLGDPTNWHYFANTSMDSYFLSLGAGGKFTGAITYQSNPIFFKEDSVHRIYGNYPANYQLKTIMGYGVKDGSAKSLSELNDTVYYLSNAGVAAYRGGIPVSMEEVFGGEKYSDGISASAGNKLYMSLKDCNNERKLFVYDDRYGFWYRESDIETLDLLTYNSKIFCLQDENIACLTEFSGLNSYENKVCWWADTGKIGFNTPWRKFINRITFRIRVPFDSEASIYVQYDSDGTWTHVTDIRPTGYAGALAVPFTPRRCDHFNIMIKGRGNVEIISFSKFYEESTDYA